jgi:smad nuclear-interacting protein 1
LQEVDPNSWHDASLNMHLLPNSEYIHHNCRVRLTLQITMDPSKGPSLRDKEERYRRQRSSSYDSSEEERRRRRRRKERERRDEEGRDSSKRDERRDAHGRHDERDRKRRRTRSPEESSRRRDDRESRRKSYKKDSYDSRAKDGRSSKDESQSQVTRKARGPLPSQEATFKADEGAVVLAEEVEKQRPNFGNTGLLAAASNSVAQIDGSSIVLKYHEPAEARKPPTKDKWKLFVFKGADILETLELSVRSCWLVGKDLAVVDLPAEHPTISKQHAVIQFRYVEKRNEFGDKLGKVKPYLIDLDSTNGTMLNKDKIEASRYVELRDKDMIQFGHSTREYVLMLDR